MSLFTFKKSTAMANTLQNPSFFHRERRENIFFRATSGMLPMPAMDGRSAVDGTRYNCALAVGTSQVSTSCVCRTDLQF